MANLKNLAACAAREPWPAPAGQLLALNAAVKKVRSSAVAEIPPVSSQPGGKGTTAVTAQSLVRRTCSRI
jgi:hypothetical protein